MFGGRHTSVQTRNYCFRQCAAASASAGLVSSTPRASTVVIVSEVRMSFPTLGALLVVLTPMSVGAAVDSSMFQDLHWRLIGPFRAGRVVAVSGVPGEPEHFYFGGVNGGVWETDDAGRTWHPVFDAKPIGSIGALAGAPSRPS